jgi:hypothetical protein
MTLFISSTYIPEILSMKQQNQLINYWKDTSITPASATHTTDLHIIYTELTPETQ